MKLYVASESSKTLESRGIRPGRRTKSPGQVIPAGEQHAYYEDATETLCERPLDGLVRFTTWQWHQASTSGRCNLCWASHMASKKLK